MTSPQDNDNFMREAYCTNQMKGDFVECGVWRGGNIIAAKLIFDEMNHQVKLYLYDTFTGMTEPSDRDIHIKTVQLPTTSCAK